MPRTANAALRDSIGRAGVDLRHIVSINPNGTEVSFIDGESSAFGLSASIASCVPEGNELDAFEGTITTGGYEIRMKADGIGRALVIGYTLKNKAIRVQLGTTEIASGSFITIWRGYIDDASIDRDGSVTLKCKDALGMLKDEEITLGVISIHPLEVIRQILSTYIPSDLWNSSTFDFTTLPNTITHWNLSRYEGDKPHIVGGVATPGAQSRAANLFSSWRDGLYRANYLGQVAPYQGSLLHEPKPAWDLIQDLLILLNGVIFYDDNGRISFKRRSTSTTPDKYLDAGSILDWKQTSAFGNLTNRIDVRFGLAGGSFRSDQVLNSSKDIATDRMIRGDDGASQADVAYPGTTGAMALRAYARTMGSSWLRMASALMSPVASAATTIDIPSASSLGFAGARYRRGFRGPSASGTGGGTTTTAVTVSSNVATVTSVGHWWQTGDYVTSTGWSVNVSTPSPVTVIDADHISVALVTSNGALADGVGTLVPEQAPIDQLSAGTREAYFLIVWGEAPDQYEIVRATAGTPTASTYVEPDPRAKTLGTGGSVIDQYSHPFSFTYTITRAQLGSTARDIPRFAVVWDITMAVAMRDERLSRYSRGAPEVSFKALLPDAFDIVVGDVVAHQVDAFAMTGLDGATSNVGLEVTSAKLDDRESPPCMNIEATWKFTATLPLATVTPTTTTYITPGVTMFGGERRSIYFDHRSPRFLEAAYDASMNTATTDLTIAFWINVGNALSTMTDTAQMSPIGRWQANQRVWQVTILANGQLRFYAASNISSDPGSNYKYVASGSIVPNKWQHVLIIYQSGSVTIWVDGVKPSLTTVGSLPSTLTTGTSRLQVGANGDSARLCQGVWVTHSCITTTAPNDYERSLYVGQYAGGVPGVPGVPGQISSVPGKISWWPFALTKQDAVGSNDLSIAGANAIDPVFSTNYPT